MSLPDNPKFTAATITRPPLHKRLINAGLLVAAFGIYALIFPLLLGESCIFKLTLGIPCPACGMTRAHLLFFRLEFSQAFAMHPMFWLSVPTAALAVLALFCPQAAHTKPYKYAVLAIIILLLSAYIIRLITLFPHTTPMDYNQKSLLYRIISGMMPAA